MYSDSEVTNLTQYFDYNLTQVPVLPLEYLILPPLYVTAVSLEQFLDECFLPKMRHISETFEFVMSP